MSKSNKPYSVLFIGNSFTARNDLPGLIARMATARGKTVRYDLINVGGASLRNHWNAGHALKAIQTGKYNAVVLQEQSTLPVKNAKRMFENVRLFDSEIKAAGAQTVLYMTWARQHAPESQQTITDAYMSIGKELDATVAPVGIAWRTFLDTHKQPVLHDKDQSHPSIAGSYLAACVFLAVLFKENPVVLDIEIDGVTAAHCKALQQVALQTTKSGSGARKKPRAKRASSK